MAPRRALRMPTPACAHVVTSLLDPLDGVTILVECSSCQPRPSAVREWFGLFPAPRIDTKAAFFLHSPPPPQAPAPSFKSPYRKCLSFTAAAAFRLFPPSHFRSRLTTSRPTGSPPA